MATSVSGSSDGPGVPGVKGDAGEFATDGVQGFTHVSGYAGVIGVADVADAVGVKGVSELQDGVQGFAKNANHSGVIGVNEGGVGVRGQSTDGNGGWFESQQQEGVRGVSHSPHGGVVGTNDAPVPGGNGGWFVSEQGEGVRGWSKNPNHAGVVGVNDNAGQGVYGQSDRGEGVRGFNNNPNHGAVVGTNEHPAGIGIFGKGGRLAGQFDGNVEVTGDMTCGGDIRLVGADFAEDFDFDGTDRPEPGSVMVLSSDGRLAQSMQGYDPRVVGVVSGAGAYRPGLIMDHNDSSGERVPIGLVGKVYCKVDANRQPVRVGDLLTSADTPGHAMKASDPMRAFGAVIGKALADLDGGQGLIPVLINLQ